MKTCIKTPWARLGLNGRSRSTSPIRLITINFYVKNLTTRDCCRMGFLMQETGLRKIFKTNFDVYLKGKRIKFFGNFTKQALWAKMTFGNSPYYMEQILFSLLTIVFMKIWTTEKAFVTGTPVKRGIHAQRLLRMLLP